MKCLIYLEVTLGKQGFPGIIALFLSYEHAFVDKLHIICQFSVGNAVQHWKHHVGTKL